MDLLGGISIRMQSTKRDQHKIVVSCGIFRMIFEPLADMVTRTPIFPESERTDDMAPVDVLCRPGPTADVHDGLGVLDAFRALAPDMEVSHVSPRAVN